MNIINKLILRPINRIKILWAYLKQGYKTELWDWEYLLEDIKWKLLLMHQQFIKDGSWCDLDKERKQIEEIVDAISDYQTYQDHCIDHANFEKESQRMWIRIWLLLSNNLRNFWN